MPFFIPDKCDINRRPASEQIVFESLKNHLPNDWIVFQSFTYVKHNQEDELWDGEADFLLFHEQYGLLDLEVKGGSISYENNVWYQDGYPMEPFEQARHNKYAILKILQKRLGQPVPIKFAHAVCFPSCKTGDVAWPPEADGVVLTGNNLKTVEEFAKKLLQDAPLPKGIMQGKVHADEIIDTLSPLFHSRQSLKERMTDDANTLFRLTEEQSHLMEALQNFPRLRIEGGAGTGKTVLAIREATMLAEQGKKVLLLCFNELLAKKINKQIGYSTNIDVAPFFQFCLDATNTSQEEYDKYKGHPLLYAKVLPEYLEKRLYLSPIAYDAIIVDEAQDFTPKMWDVVMKMLMDDGNFYIFYDFDQNIFQDHLHLPTFDFPPIKLTRNCRNTMKIIDALKPYHDIEMRPMENTPDGYDVIEKTGDCKANLEEILNYLFKEEKINQADVVILGGHSLHHTCLGDNPHVGDFTLVENPRTLASKHLPYYTYMKFKGCEAKVVILLDVDEQDPRWNRAGMYTAMSRANLQLYILRKG